MAVALTQVITEDRASGGQVIDGSLRFVSGNSNHLNRTSAAGNRRTFTASAWVKKTNLAQSGFQSLVSWTDSGGTKDEVFAFHISNASDTVWIFSRTGATSYYISTSAVLRDPSAWYHLVFVVDTTQATDTNRFKIYVNGELASIATSAYPPQNHDLPYVNVNGKVGYIGAWYDNPWYYLNGYLDQVIFIDGFALDASYFGFTDPLTNTWRPKKYTGTYGTNGFYLPMDGNSPIGEDKSGNGNNWTPVNFGGSNTIEKATGALPILNTGNGGNVAVSGVFGSKVSKTLTTTASTNTSNGFVFANEGTKPTLSFVRGATYTFDYSASTAHPLRFATAADAAGSTQYTDGTDTSVANTVKITVPHNAPDTLYYYCTNHGGMGNTISVTTDEKVADPYAWKNVLALPLVGSTADVSNQINSARTALTFTAQGNAAPTSTQSNFYGGSYTFDGSNDRLFTNIPNGDALYLQNSNFTVECWVRLASGQTDDRYMLTIANGTASNANGSWQMRINGSKFNPGFTSGSTQYNLTSTQNYVPNKWTHVAFVREGNEQRLYIDGVLDVTTSYTQTPNNLTSGQLSIGGVYNNGSNSINGQIQDVRIYDGVAKYTSNFIPASTDPDILPDTPSGVAGGSALTSIPDSATEGAVAFDGSGDYIGAPSSTDYDLNGVDWTVEFYMYAISLSGVKVIAENRTDGAGGWSIQLSGSSLAFYFAGAWNPSNTLSVAKWHHVALVRSSSTTTLYVDGISKGTTASDAGSTASNGMFIGARSSPNYEFPGFISNFRVVKGTAVYTSNFTPPTAPLTNITNTKLLCCQSTTSATAAAVIPTGSFTANGNAIASKFSPFMPDNINAVRGQESGWATFNPLQTTAVSSSDTSLTNGNLDISFTASANNYSSYLTQSINSGKFYLEVTINSSTTSNSMIGFVGDNNLEAKRNATASAVPGLQGTYGKGVDGTGALYNGAGVNAGSYMPSWSQGDVIMVQIDADNDRFYLGKNGILQTTAITFPAGTTKPYHFGVGDSSGSVAASFSLNTGQKPFKYAPPEGFQPLCLANLPRPTKAALQPDKYFKTILYTGNDSTQTITGLNFSPDFIWAKNRDTAGYHHDLYDRVRGDNLRIFSSSASTEVTGYLQFGTNSFNLTSGGGINASGDAHVAWCWKAGGAAVSNTDGSITSQVSANRDAGFSIVSYSGNNNSSADVGHGLGVSPDLVIVKDRSTSNYVWMVKFAILGGNILELNGTGIANAPGTYSTGTIGTLTSTTFGFTTGGSLQAVNNTGQNYIAYCWSEVPGFSKFGSYTGNSNSDGPFVYCGFRPAWILLKSANGGSWELYDTARDTYNQSEKTVEPNSNAVEGSSYPIDILSNGFKVRTSNSQINYSSYTYVFAAFAEAPTNNLFGGQANAR